MPKTFFHRLASYLKSTGEGLQAEAKRSAASPNPTDIGQAREQTYLAFLRDHLPGNCRADLGGFLFGMGGDESQQIDVVVTNNRAPTFALGEKRFAPIDGCVAVATIKSMLDSNELRDALKNLESLPSKQSLGDRAMPQFNVPDYDDWPIKIVYGYDGVAAETLRDTLNRYYVENAVPPDRRPNLIHIAGKYFYFRIGSRGGTARDGRTLAPNEFSLAATPTDAWPLLWVITEIQNRAQASEFVLYDYEELLRVIPLE